MHECTIARYSCYGKPCYWYAEHLVFKGGTSLSNTYGVIRRFSEDVDLTYDIRAIARDLVGDTTSPLPASKSQEKKWTKEIRARLLDWVSGKIVPLLSEALGKQGLPATAKAVADHKRMFFSEKDVKGGAIDYHAAVSGALQLVPSDGALVTLADNYRRMVEDGLLLDDAEPFDALLARCQAIQNKANTSGK